MHENGVPEVSLQAFLGGTLGQFMMGVFVQRTVNLRYRTRSLQDSPLLFAIELYRFAGICSDNLGTDLLKFICIGYVFVKRQ